jgi:predicted transcriptional regulator
MLTDLQVILWTRVIVTTLLDCPEHTSPRTPIYLAMNGNIDNFNEMETLLIRSNNIITTPDTMTLTAKGVELANKINKAFAKKSGG